MMSEEINAEPVSECASEYQTPAIEEVVTREGLEREVAYAGVVSPGGAN
jgi:hypothetical protein